MSIDAVFADESANKDKVLHSLKQLNSLLDFVFYDVSSLMPAEQTMLEDSVTLEGSGLIVQPAEGIERLGFRDLWQRLESQPEQVPRVIVVAGVGSSDLGTAALARDVANCLKQPVLGIVSGYGMANVLSEALGGWFVFGATNALRQALVLPKRQATTTGAWPAQIRHALHPDVLAQLSAEHADGFIPGSVDSAALMSLLHKHGSHFTLLVGHSKGNYSIENALEGVLALAQSQQQPVPEIKIVTLGAVVYFPSQFKDVHQVLGSLDLLGLINSRWGLLPNSLPLPGRWHSLNSGLLGAMSVDAALSKAGVV